MIGTGKIVLGVALVENAYHKTCKIAAAAAPGDIHETDRICLRLGEFRVSALLLERFDGNPEFEVIRGLGPMPRDEQGNLLWT